MVGFTAGAVALSLLLSDSARAEDYLVVQCHSQHSFGAVFAGFSSNGQRPQASNNCGNSGGIGVFEAGGPAADGVWGQWAWTAPPTTHFTRIDYKENTNDDSGWKAYFSYTPYPTGNNKAHQAKKQNEWVQGYPVTDPARDFHVFLECFGGCTDGAGHAYVKNVFFTVEDPIVPTLGLGGEVLDSGARHGAESLTISGTDQGSGVRSATVAVNSVPVSSQIFTCAFSSNSLPSPSSSGPAPNQSHSTQHADRRPALAQRDERARSLCP